jgi:outer membrane murein-binding lipoprotein Lpp
MKRFWAQYGGPLLRRSALFGVFSATFLIGGCSDRSQQLEDRVADLKKKIEQLQAQLDAAKQGNEQEKPSAESTSSGALPTKEALESTYEASSKELKNKIAAKLTGFSVENYTTHSVQMSENVYPFTSKISFSIRSNDGKAYQMDLPVKADYTGKWVFPNTDEIVARINSAKNMTPITEKEAASNTASSSQEATQNRPPIMNVDGTIVIQWGDAQKPKASTPRTSDSTSAQTSTQPPQPSAPPTSTTPAPSAIKPPVMPVDRDVHIKFNQ